MRELKNHRSETPNVTLQHTLSTGNQHKKRFMRRLTVFFVITFIIVASIGTVFYKQKVSIKSQQAQIKELTKHKDTLEAEGQKLKGEIQKLQDDEYVAKIARRDYYFSKPGEVIIPIAK